MGGNSSKVPPLTAMTTKIPGGANSLMGYWYVASCVPTFVEKGAHNSLENYEWIDETEQKLKVTFSYKGSATQKKPAQFFQDGRVVNKETGAEWTVRPRLFGGNIPLPMWLPFIVLEAELPTLPEKAYMVVGQPDRSYLWIMFRSPDYDEEIYEQVEKRCVEEYGYKKEDIYKVPHSWPEDRPRTDPSKWATVTTTATTDGSGKE